MLKINKKYLFLFVLFRVLIHSFNLPQIQKTLFLIVQSFPYLYRDQIPTLCLLISFFSFSKIFFESSLSFFLLSTCTLILFRFCNRHISKKPYKKHSCGNPISNPRTIFAPSVFIRTKWLHIRKEGFQWCWFQKVSLLEMILARLAHILGQNPPYIYLHLHQCVVGRLLQVDKLQSK